jgi:hypothetical protein
MFVVLFVSQSMLATALNRGRGCLGKEYVDVLRIDSSHIFLPVNPSTTEDGNEIEYYCEMSVDLKRPFSAETHEKNDYDTRKY